MVYNSVKYVQFGKKIGHEMIILLVPILSFKKKMYNHNHVLFYGATDIWSFTW